MAWRVALPLVSRRQKIQFRKAAGWRKHLRRIAITTAAIFFLLALTAGGPHRHASASSLHRIDCQACAWVRSASGALSHAAPVLALFIAGAAPRAHHVSVLITCAASPHDGRAPPFFLV